MIGDIGKESKGKIKGEYLFIAREHTGCLERNCLFNF